MTYNPSLPDHAGRNHHEPKWVADLLLYQADNQTERVWGSVRKRREGRGISARETKDRVGDLGSVSLKVSIPINWLINLRTFM